MASSTPFMRILNTFKKMGVKRPVLIDCFEKIVTWDLHGESVNPMISRLKLEYCKLEREEILMSYIEFVSKDHLITFDERGEILILKLMFYIGEGDIIAMFPERVKAIIDNQTNMALQASVEELKELLGISNTHLEQLNLLV